MKPSGYSLALSSGQSLYNSPKGLAKIGVLGKQLHVLILCHLQLVSLRSPLSSKLRAHFAEFLRDSSLYALVYSTCIPVSVWGTVMYINCIVFLALLVNRTFCNMLIRSSNVITTFAILRGRYNSWSFNVSTKPLCFRREWFYIPYRYSC